MSVATYDGPISDLKYLNWLEHPITFSRADQWSDIPYAGCFPLVLNPNNQGRVLPEGPHRWRERPQHPLCQIDVGARAQEGRPHPHGLSILGVRPQEGIATPRIAHLAYIVRHPQALLH